MSNTVYPDWVQQYRTKGMTIKKKGEGYYLYRRTSKRVPGKKYPQPVEYYEGVITPEGLIRGDRRIIHGAAPCVVTEFGFTSAVWLLCPQEWKNPLKDEWEDALKSLILTWSPCSCLSLVYQKKDPDSFRCNFQSQSANLIRRFRQADKKWDIRDLDPLKSVYLVRLGDVRLLSRINEEQQKVLDKYGLEVTLNGFVLR